MEQLPIISNQLTKTQIKLIAQQSVNDLLERGNPIQVAEAISKMELLIKEIKADQRYIDYVREELIKLGKSTQSESGTKIECAEVGTKYDYNNCGDTKWQMFKQQVDSATQSLKEREEFLKTIPYGGLQVLDDVTGELVHINPPIKTSTSSYKVTIGK
jgi:hypothetical protein